MKCEYKAERISGDLEKYLNEKGSQGWRCVSVTTATGLGWTQTVVWEKEIDWEIRDQENGKKILRYEYKVERISGDLEKYLNEKGSQGWRCVSVTTATGLGWTQIVVLEKKLDDLPATEYIDIPKQEEHENDTNKVEICNKNLNETANESSNPVNVEKVIDQKAETDLNENTNSFLHIFNSICLVFMLTILTYSVMSLFVQSIHLLLDPDYSMKIEINPLLVLLLAIAVLGNRILNKILEDERNKKDEKPADAS